MPLSWYVGVLSLKITYEGPVELTTTFVNRGVCHLFVLNRCSGTVRQNRENKAFYLTMVICVIYNGMGFSFFACHRNCDLPPDVSAFCPPA